jgi:hypothetical protein
LREKWLKLLRQQRRKVQTNFTKVSFWSKGWLIKKKKTRKIEAKRMSKANLLLQLNLPQNQVKKAKGKVMIKPK